MKLTEFQLEGLRELDRDHSRVDQKEWPEWKLFLVGMLALGALLATPADYEGVRVSAAWSFTAFICLFACTESLSLNTATTAHLLSPRRVNRATCVPLEQRRAGVLVSTGAAVVAAMFWHQFVTAGCVCLFLSLAILGQERTYRVRTLTALERMGRQSLTSDGVNCRFAIHDGVATVPFLVAQDAGLNEDDLVEIANTDNGRTIFRRARHAEIIVNRVRGEEPVILINRYDAEELQISSSNGLLSVSAY